MITFLAVWIWEIGQGNDKRERVSLLGKFP